MNESRETARDQALDKLLRDEMRVEPARVDALWQAIQPRLADTPQLAAVSPALRRAWRLQEFAGAQPLAAAASLLLGLGLLGWLLESQPGGSPDAAPHANSLAAAVDPVDPGGAFRYRGAVDSTGHWRPGGPRQIFRAGQEIEATEQRPLRLRLPDDSTVFVSGGSAVRFEAEGLRLLRGSVYLRVRPQAKGLVVLTDQARVAVLGTRFLVVTDGQRTSTVVVEGRVSCDPPAGPPQPPLTAGMRRDIDRRPDAGHPIDHGTGGQQGRGRTWTSVDLRSAIAWVPGGEADLPAPATDVPGAAPAPGPQPADPIAPPPPFPGADQLPENWKSK